MRLGMDRGLGAQATMSSVKARRYDLFPSHHVPGMRSNVHAESRWRDPTQRVAEPMTGLPRCRLVEANGGAACRW